MNPIQEESEGRKAEIKRQFADLSRLLSMMPSDGAIQIREPLSQNEMALSDWLSATRESFLKLSLLISRELDIQLQ